MTDEAEQQCAECIEQARLLDMSATREAALKAQVAELETALRELLTDMVIAQGNMRNAVRRGDRMWEKCAEAIQPRVAAAREALARATGETT